MKKQSKMILLTSIVFLNYSCINQVHPDITSGTVPITFSTQIVQTTRAIETSFERGDRVGLYAILTSNSINQKRYIDNIWLESGEGGILIPEKTVFYPEGDAKLNFISYYPYQMHGIEAGKAEFPISVQNDQSSKEQYSQSDFLIAKASDIAESNQPIELNYIHKLSKIKIVLKPQDGENAADILKANPKIVATGFKTQASYNVEDDSFSNLTKEMDIVPYGNWTINRDGNLTGKEFIIIPQTMEATTHTFSMDWNGRLYTCPMPELSMTGSNQCEISISALQSSNPTLTGIAGSITDWNTANGGSTENKETLNAIHLASLSFALSNVYRVYHEGRPIAEICKEYLRSDDLTSRTITSYPINEDEEVDLSQGTVLQLLDKSDAINGGNISWDIQTNTFSYIQGSLPSIQQFYLDSNGKVLLEKPDDPININITSYTIRDIRGGTLQNYPIVKIGAQYWMRENLHTTMYQNGTEIPEQTELGNGAGYFKPEDQDYYFYNGEAILSGELAPEKWKIPNLNNWRTLQAYINNNTSLLKVGKWLTFNADDPIYPATGESGLDIKPEGLFVRKSEGVTNYVNPDRSAAFWISGDSNGTLSEKAVLLKSNTDTISFGNSSLERQALSIRCIKE